MKFKLFGIEFEISFLFTAVLALIVATDKTGNIFLFFAASAIHEAAHLFAMYFVKAKPSDVKLIPGGINIVDKSVKTPMEDILILASGPIANLICYFIFNNDFSALSLLLFIYNMLPISGLDGGRIAHILFSKLFSICTAGRLMTVLTVVASAAFALIFIYLLLNGIENYSVLIFSLYIISTIFFKKGVERKS